MTSLFILPLLASAPASQAINIEQPKFCPPAVTQAEERKGFTLRRGPFRPNERFGNGAQINQYLLVMRTVDGCIEPVIVRRDVAPRLRPAPRIEK
jgi:hypothetical protein